MAKAKKELDTFKVLDTAAKKIEEASKIMEKGEDLIEGFAESAESLEKQAENLGLRLGNMLNRLQVDEDGSIFQDLASNSNEDLAAITLRVNGKEIKCKRFGDRLEFYAAVRLMIELMRNHKNNVGFEDFILVIDELEFMFFASFYTEIGFHQDIDGYMRIHSQFITSGEKDRLYQFIGNDVSQARNIFNRYYSTWEAESHAFNKYIIDSVTPANRLAEKIDKLLDDGGILPDMMQIPDIQNMIIGALSSGAVAGAEENMNQGSTEPQVLPGMMFQKVQIGDQPSLTVLKGRKKN